MKKITLLIIIALAIVSIPFFMWVAWMVSPKQKLVIAIIDKSVTSTDRQEHASLSWVLNYEKYTKTKAKKYNERKDYFGFFPQPDKKFQVKGLERFSTFQLNRLGADCDVAYYADTYGIYSGQWFGANSEKANSGILYGGISEQDLYFMSRMKQNRKLIISEFNTIGSSSTPVNRNRFEKMFGLISSGWTACFFTSLDTAVNKELPHWLINNYKLRNKGMWPFKQAGVAFVNNEGNTVILEEGNTLNEAIPNLLTDKNGQETFNVAAKIKYCLWFDVVVADTSINKVVSTFDINFNAVGIEMLKKNNIPLSFPAVIMHKHNDYGFYYFAGDFSNNSVPKEFSYFKCISIFENFFYKKKNLSEKQSLFWKFYRPMLTSILRTYYTKSHRGK